MSNQADPQANKEEYDKFFRKLIRHGAPAEIILCVSTENDPGKISMLCKKWNINQHLALRWAVFEYITHVSGFALQKWSFVINKLLALGADPNYKSNDFVKMTDKNYWQFNA